MKLRPYQSRWLQRVRKSNGRVLVVGPTGSGKTVVAAHIIRDAQREGKRVLFLAHRRELVDQCVKRLEGVGVDDVGVIMAGREARGAAVQVASIQSLIRRRIAQFDVVLIDEAHHATAPSYQAVLERSPKAKVYGLTATPQRLDGKPLNDLFDTIAQSDTAPQLIEQGALAKVVVWTHPPDDLRNVKRSGGDYNASELSKRVKRKHIGDMIAHWERFAKGRPTVVFAINVAHAERITTEFNRSGYAAELLTSKTPAEERAAMLDGLSSGKVQLVVNVEVLTEGWDCPAVACVIMARPTLSETMCRQQMGRAMRPNPDWPNSVILDHVGNTLLHGMPFSARDWSDALQPKERVQRLHGDMVTKTKPCPACECTISFGARTCSFCDHEFWKNEPPVEVQGWLKRVEEDPREWAIEQVRSGRKVVDVAKDLGVDRFKVHKWCKGIHSIVQRTPQEAAALRKRVLRLVQSGMSAHAAAKSVGVRSSTAWKWAKEEGLRLRPSTKKAGVRSQVDPAEAGRTANQGRST